MTFEGKHKGFDIFIEGIDPGFNILVGAAGDDPIYDDFFDCATMAQAKREAKSYIDRHLQLQQALVEHDRAMRDDVIPAIEADLRDQARVAARLRRGLPIEDANEA